MVSKETFIERFMDKCIPEPNSGCLLWLANASPVLNRPTYDERGMFRLYGKWQSASRASYQLFCGEIPPGQVVRHTCDVGLCVNPNHLVLGTQYDNVQDCKERGRIYKRHGERTPFAVLTEDTVREIRGYHVPGVVGAVQIAAKMGLNKHTVAKVINRQSWSHIA